jgi:hypothetical protein
MKHRLTVLPAALLLSGCAASLDVQVDVLNPNYARTAARDAQMVNELQLIAGGNDVRLASFIKTGFDDLAALGNECLQLKIDEAARQLRDAEQTMNTMNRSDDSKPDTAAIARQQEIIDEWIFTKEANESSKSTITALIISARKDFSYFIQNQNDAISSLVNRGKPIGEFGTAIDPEIRAILNKRQALFDEHSTIVSKAAQQYRSSCLQRPAPSASALVPLVDTKQRADAIDAQAQLARYNANRSVIGGGELLTGMGEAYFVTKAPDEYWAKSFNRALGNGFGGSTSVGIKLNETGDFSVKGFIFDGTSTAQMMKKVTVQAVSLLAAAYGAPVGINPAAANQPASANFTANANLANAEVELIAAKAEAAAYSAFLFRLADAVLANAGQLKSIDEPARKAAKDIIKASFDAQKAVWN